MDDVARNQELVRRFTSAVNARDLDKLDAIVAADFRRHCPATPGVEVRNLDDLRRFLESDFAACPDSVVSMNVMTAEANRVAFWATYAATQTGPMGPFPPSGRRASTEFAGYFVVDGGKLAEMYVTWDNVDVLTQLGHLPAGPD